LRAAEADTSPTPELDADLVFVAPTPSPPMTTSTGKYHRCSFAVDCRRVAVRQLSCMPWEVRDTVGGTHVACEEALSVAHEARSVTQRALSVTQRGRTPSTS
jgi:hypothetical protein